MSLTECLKGIIYFKLDNQKDIKILSSILIRRLLDIENTDNDKQLWRIFSLEMKNQIKINILTAMISESERFIKNKLADALSRIAENVYENNEEWPEILAFINEVFGQKEKADHNLAECVLTIFCEIFKHLSETQVKNLQIVTSAFTYYFNTLDLNLRTKSVNTIAVIIKFSKKKYSNYFLDFVLSILETTSLCLQDPKHENNV